jgi:hypothetical protein
LRFCKDRPDGAFAAILRLNPQRTEEIPMSRLLSVLVASVAAVAFNATAAEQAGDPQRKDNQTQAQPNATKGKPEQSDANATGGASRPSQAGASETNRTGQPSDADSSAGTTHGTADNTQHNQTPNQANQAGADEGNMGRRPNQPGGDVDAKEKEYLADVEKCNSMSGNRKTECISAAKKKAGQM